MSKNDRNPDFERIVTVTMAEVVEERIRDYLKKKKLKPGDAIPKETELAESLGVSRNVIREALSRFRMLGLIESRKKRGMILTKPDIFNGFERVLDPNLLDDNTLIDIFEMRLVLEMGLADLLYLKKKPEDIDILEKIVRQGQNSKVFKLEQEVEFHGKLYAMTGNVTLLRFQKMLLPIFEFVIAKEIQQKKPRIVGKVDHQQLVEILKKGSPSEFRQGMYEHLKPHFEWIKSIKN